MAFLCFLSLCLVNGKVYNIFMNGLKKRGECQTKNKDFHVVQELWVEQQHDH